MSLDVKKFRNSRNAILFLELAGLLHDIGKLSKEFLEYRMKWQNDPNGWGNDPHDNQFLTNYEASDLKNLVMDIFKRDFIKPLKDSGFTEADFTIWKAVEEHTQGPKGDIMMKLLRAADRVDSIIDRNNPLWSNEQKKEIYQSNVFGYESGRVVDLRDQQNARETLYKNLKNLLETYCDGTARGFSFDQRKKIFSAIKEAFGQGLSDTTRPQNDTTLWEHSYAVASIFKALVAHYLITKELLDGMEGNGFELMKVQFRILGMGWDGLRFISQGYKIGDLVGRKKVLDMIKDKAREIVEWQYALGNEVYSDDDGIYFVVPKCMDKSELADPVMKDLVSEAVQISCGELQPYFSLSDDTFTMTTLVRVISDIRKKAQFPFDQSQKPDVVFTDSIKKLKEPITGIVCSICKVRSVKELDSNERICETCLKRREDARLETGIGDGKHTVFIDEIADRHDRVAAIVARFNLDNWLNGNMIRTMFVTEAHGIDREIMELGTVKEKKFQDGEAIKKTFFNPNPNPPNYDYNKIKEDIEAFFSSDPKKQTEACHKAILYDRRNNYNPDIDDIKKRWEGLKRSALNEHGLPNDPYGIVLPNILCAKTPTPSTILDVWDTTKEFFEEKVQPIIEKGVEERYRLKLILKNGLKPEGGKGTLEAVLIKGNRRCEILPLGDGSVEVIGETFSEKARSEWQGDLSIEGNLYEIKNIAQGKQYRQFRTIAISPNLFISLAPAEKAVRFASEIYKEYLVEFGKVMGRLPFNIGVIFFDRPLPMFVVLDAAKRTIANFDILSEKDRNLRISSKSEDKGRMIIDVIDQIDDRKIQWSLPLTLGNCSLDTHHCYMLLSDGDNGTSRKTYFRTIAGDVIHFSELQESDIIKVYPNYFDFAYLDSNARRYEVMIDESTLKRVQTAPNGGVALPVFLDELDQKIIRIWDVFLKGKGLQEVTDTKVRNLWSLWSIKRQEWGQDGFVQWKKFIKDSLIKEFKLGLDDEAYLLIEEMLRTGLLFETMELFMSILKERIGES